jgi:hypothetical protein
MTTLCQQGLRIKMQPGQVFPLLFIGLANTFHVLLSPGTKWAGIINVFFQ